MSFRTVSLLCCILTMTLAAFVVLGRPQKGGSPSAAKPVLAETIAAAGHGKLFDRQMKEIRLTEHVIDALQRSILAEIEAADLEPKDPRVRLAREEAEKLLRAQKLQGDERLLVQGAVAAAALGGSGDDLTRRFGWRNEALLTHLLGRRGEKLLLEIRPEVLALLRRLGLVFEPPEVPATTDYIEDCRAHQVPIPPDWAESGTPWVEQGTLAENLLDPGGYAAVWTYTDPARRGGCVALPRGDGSPGSAAGIICQSATTGHACFWDNKLRGVEPEQFLGWSGLRLEIAALKDGSNLASACTGCHRGNNVFLLSPDDATWAKLLRGPLSGPRPGTFTTRVESSTDVRDGHPRYIPVTTLPPRVGWENSYVPRGCAGDCHETPSTPSNPPMPPVCAAPSFSDPSGCYGTP